MRKKGVEGDSSVFGWSNSRLELPFTDVGKMGAESTFGIMSLLGWEKIAVTGLVPRLS